MKNTFRGTLGPRATCIGEPPQTAEEREIREERAAASYRLQAGWSAVDCGGEGFRMGMYIPLGARTPSSNLRMEDWRRKEVPHHLRDRAVYPFSVDCLR